MIFWSLSIFLPCSLHAKDFYRKRYNISVSGNGEDAEKKELLELACRSEVVLRRFLKISRKTTPSICQFFVAESANSLGKDFLCLEKSFLWNTRRILIKLVGRISDELSFEHNLKIPEWFIAANIYRIYHEKLFPNSGNYTNYHATKLLFEKNGHPYIIEICEKPVNPSFEYSYLLYAQHCSLIFDCLRYELPAKCHFPKIFFSSLNKSSSYENFFRIFLKGQLNKEETIQEWYIRTSSKYTAVSRFTLKIEDIKISLEKLENIEVAIILPEGMPGFKNIPIEETLKDKNIDYFSKRAIKKLYNDIFSLYMKSPEYIKPYIKNYLHAVNCLSAGKKKLFIRKFKEAKKQFSMATGKYKKIINFMDETEAEFFMIGIRFNYLFRVFGENSNSPIDKYLDEIEQEIYATP
ncbi:MAG: hypothetical protein U9O87_03520 [Verrucomicrobiota bacterium]|nr:hypothetical protein [Verrucomicrobiota bacterium]